jgi:hypothetical protein
MYAPVDESLLAQNSCGSGGKINAPVDIGLVDGVIAHVSTSLLVWPQRSRGLVP